MQLKKDPAVIVSFTLLVLGLGVLCALKVITWPQALAGIPLMLAPSVLGRKNRDSAGPPPAVVLLVAASTAFTLVGTGGCAPSSAQEKAREAEEAYSAAHKNCAATEKSREAIDDCRAKVRAEWNVADPKAGSR